MSSLIIRTNIYLLIAVFMTVSACSSASKNTTARMGLTQSTNAADLMAGLRNYESGDYLASARAFDRLLAKASPNDSQLIFIALYYGIRSRLADGQNFSADSLFEALHGFIPAMQEPELKLILGRRAGLERNISLLKEYRMIAHKIGVVLPLSGKFSEFGQAILEGVKLAVQEYNKGVPPERQVLLEILDDGSDPASAAALGRNLADDSLVAAIIGSYENETSLALSFAAAASGIPLVCPTADAPGLDNLGPLVHVLNRNDKEMAASLARFSVQALGLGTFGIMASDDERGTFLADIFAREVRHTGGVIISSLRYTSQTSNFENQMYLLSRYFPDAIYLPAKSSELTQLASQVHFYGLGQARLLGTEQWNSERVIRLGDKYVEGTVFYSPFYENGEDLRWNEFKDLYEKTYRRTVNRYSAQGYDAAGLIVAAADSLPTDRKLLAENLNRIDSYPGAMAVYTIGSDGRVKRKIFILELLHGNVVKAGAEETVPENLERGPEITPQDSLHPGSSPR